MTWEERMRTHTIERNGESKLKKKLPTPANWDNGIKIDVVVVISSVYLSISIHPSISICLSLMRFSQDWYSTFFWFLNEGRVQ